MPQYPTPVPFCSFDIVCREAAPAVPSPTPKPAAAAAAAAAGSSVDKSSNDKSTKPGTAAAAAGGSTTPTPTPSKPGCVVGAAAAPRCAPQYELEPAASATDIPVPEYGTVAWVINSCLSLIGSRAFEYGELKKAMLQAVIIVITGNGAKYNEPVLFMRIMVRGGGGEGGGSAKGEAACGCAS